MESPPSVLLCVGGCRLKMVYKVCFFLPKEKASNDVCLHGLGFAYIWRLHRK